MQPDILLYNTSAILCSSRPSSRGIGSCWPPGHENLNVVGGSQLVGGSPDGLGDPARALALAASVLGRDLDGDLLAAVAGQGQLAFFEAMQELIARQVVEEVAPAEYRFLHDKLREIAYERIPQEEVAALLWRSKIHLLWSRREGANRAIIEAMLADVPVIVRDGMTFGFRYPYINDQTGRFVPEAALADAMVEMIDTRDRYSPRGGCWRT